MKIILNYIRPYTSQFFVILVLTSISQILILSSPYVLGNEIIDPFVTKAQYYREHGLKSDYFNGVIKGFIVFVLLSTGFWIVRITKDYILNINIKKISSNLFLDINKWIFRNNLHYFEDIQSGKLISLSQKVKSDVENFIAKAINVLFVSVINFFILMYITFDLSPFLPLVYTLLILALCSFIYFLSKKIMRIQIDIIDQNTSLFGFITESLRNFETIISLNVVNNELEKISGKIDQVLNIELKKEKQIQKFSALYCFVIYAIQFIILFVLIYLVYEGDVSIGQLVMLQMYFFIIFVSLEEFGGVVVAYRETSVSLKDVIKIKDHFIETVPSRLPAINQIDKINFKDVSFSYGSSPCPTLINISFNIAKGETLAIVGPSGSGKSTILKLLLGLYDPSSGFIEYNGKKLNRLEKESLRKKIGIVGQDTHLFSGSIRENMLFAKDTASEMEIVEALAKASCESLLSKVGRDLDSVIGEGGIKLSGGEKQRLAIARSLLRDSSLYIFDEATSSLDSFTEAEISDCIRSVSKLNNSITIMVAHRLSTVMFADRIMVVKDGSIIEIGPHEKLLAQNGEYARMWNLQIGKK
ncbi:MULTISPECIES: ABC transporter ATP-binding protein [Sphingobacterium]|uniref:ABC transporter ATP-binding protein n=1 Tax=Sphingobacterium TaxID=28453 RepID=UPI0025805699|nr:MULTISPECIES: ABC transporter ATP-binding protein [Sphingobacterium]